MKQTQNARRARARGPKRGGNGQAKGRMDGKVKGNPKQQLEKYKSMARDAQQAGDRILAENYLQHADHFQRVMNERMGLSSGLFEDEDQSANQGGQQRRNRRQRSQPNGQAKADPAEAPQPDEVRDEAEMQQPDRAPAAEASDENGEERRPRRRRRAPRSDTSSKDSDAEKTAEPAA